MRVSDLAPSCRECRPEIGRSAAGPLRDEVLAGAFFGLRSSRGCDARRGVPASCRQPRRLPRGSAPRWRCASPAIRDACRGALDRDIAAIDALIGAQLDAILHHQRLRRFEGSWRALAWLAGGLDPAGRVKVKVLNISWAELCRDLERAVEFDQSQLFRKVYESEFGMPGGEPYGLLVIDHEVRHRPMQGAPTDDVNALAQLVGGRGRRVCADGAGGLADSVAGRGIYRPRDGRPISPTRSAVPSLLAGAALVGARGHAVYRSHFAAGAGASALGGRSGAGRRFPLRRIRAGRRQPRVDDRRICLCRCRRARFRQPCLAGRRPRRRNRLYRRRAGHRFADRAVPHRPRSRLGAPAARSYCSPTASRRRWSKPG